ncbi:zinc-binding dehydrogenase [Amycolatopsis keratiniphila]|uniref:zinc-binding dehydrogenase n=1 Tax=Amycolatopsis keratiniphila TaxID=129921 RepID=UPI00087CA1BE|nr:zinc-binding dehydrogenase [Amycolatopsis keratiniphila]OLZ58795.1 quinone oxidoreductase [Amycolatopsis keratiniphila subsp. nogabecina]SDU69804.1 Alcohol dehydrogenase GroES-like domain-containing protein [Amycolatopsis keratiniphila]
MREIRVSRFGDPSVLEQVEVSTPEPGPGELRVAVTAAGVGWLDALIRRGDGPDVFAVEPPYVPGGSVAGTVDAVGAGVDEAWLGEVVLTHAPGGYGGGYADTVVALPDDTFPIPERLDPRHAVALFDDGSTALALLEKTPVAAGERILVMPGVGGLGSVLVQLARAAGTTVFAAVRGEEKAAIARKLGAEPVDYSAADWTGDVLALTGGHRLDVVFDGVGGELGAASLALLANGGRFSGYGMSSGAETVIGDADRARLSVVDMAQLVGFWPDNPRRVREILRRAAEGTVTPVIGRTYPLAEASAAHSDIEARRYTGKSLLLP